MKPLNVLIRKIRKGRNLTQTQVARVLGITQQYYSKYEKGLTQPNIDTLIKLSEIFSVSIDYLTGVSDIPNPYTAEKFTPKEANIILEFRRLSKENQIRIDERLSAMIDAQDIKDK